MSSATCPKCGVAVTADERFCSGCGASLSADPAIQAFSTLPSVTVSPHVKTTRTVLIILAVLALIGGFAIYWMQKGEVDKVWSQVEAQFGSWAPEDRDDHFQRHVGMTYEQAKKHDYGMVKLQLFVNLGLSVIYLGLFFWAKRRAYMAALIALMLFVTVIVVSAVLEPNTIYQGIIVKIAVIFALAQAVKSGRLAQNETP